MGADLEVLVLEQAFLRLMNEVTIVYDGVFTEGEVGQVILTNCFKCSAASFDLEGRETGSTDP